MTMASSKNKLTEEQLHEGVMSAILGAILKGRIKTVTKALENDPELVKLAKDVNKATDKLKKSIEKAKKSSRKVSTRPDGGPEKRFGDLQKQVNKMTGGKY